ncbi:hypothetical protein LY76DRAFT_598334 [Colletotrichum caudatum]|nr:hypothetical protein LY76DRAFT_598334 [Colletotrichum caudatum]
MMALPFYSATMRSLQGSFEADRPQSLSPCLSGKGSARLELTHGFVPLLSLSLSLFSISLAFLPRPPSSAA